MWEQCIWFIYMIPAEMGDFLLDNLQYATFLYNQPTGERQPNMAGLGLVHTALPVRC